MTKYNISLLLLRTSVWSGREYRQSLILLRTSILEARVLIMPLAMQNSANGNSVPAVFWMIVEALQRPNLLSRGLDEIVTSQSWDKLSSNPLTYIETLSSMPILQSMYAETLRLYTSLLSLRSISHGDFNLADFTIPNDELLAVDSLVAATDKSIWNDEKYPLNEFWAERFLAYPNDYKSGPLPFNRSSKPTALSHREAFAHSNPHQTHNSKRSSMQHRRSSRCLDAVWRRSAATSWSQLCEARNHPELRNRIFNA